MPNTWILVADTGGARVYESRGAGAELRLVRDLPTRAEPAARRFVIELDASKASRPVAAGTAVAEATSGAAPVEAGRFARELAWLLGRARAERFFHRLVLVGPTDVLGTIRRELDPPTRALASHAPSLADVSGL